MRCCKVCGREIKGRNYCESCRFKVALIKKFIKACDEFKEIIGYDEILRSREERENNGDT
jgi:hypothetical protein